MPKKNWSCWFLLSILFLAGCGSKVTETTPEAFVTPVLIAQSEAKNVVDYEEFTGRTDANFIVEVRSRVTGYLLKKNFKDGDEVRKGDILYEIDDRPYQTSLTSAEAQLAQSVAHRLRLEADFHRATNLFEKGSIGREEFDRISGDYAEAQAAVNIAKARLDTARLNFDFTKIRAPMDGILSRTLVDPGNLVVQERTMLTDLVASDKLYVNFDINEVAMDRVRSLIEQGRVGSKNGKEIKVYVGTSVDADQFEEANQRLLEVAIAQKRQPTEEEKQRVPEEFPYLGLVNFTENKLDAATGTLRVRGTIDKPGILSPGVFVRIHLPIGDPHPAVLIRDQAVGSNQGRNFVYVIDRDNDAEFRTVELGSMQNGLREIKSGLKAGEWIIDDAEGINKVRPGSRVSPSVSTPKRGAEKVPPQDGLTMTRRLTHSSESAYRTKDDLLTPALLVDLDRLESNLSTMADHCRREGCHFRPHAKTHKCPEIARMQVASGARGISTATVFEAEAMVDAGLSGILLTSPIVEPGKIARMVALLRSGAEILLAVGHDREVEILSEAAKAAGVVADVLVDVDVGDGRFGINPGQPALELARRIDRHPSLRIQGVQAYLGKAAHVVGFEARKSLSVEAMLQAVETRDLLAKSGFNAGFLSCGSTGTYDIDSRLPGEIELQSGSYVFMDEEYRTIGGPDGRATFDAFLPSLTVLTTVVSATHGDRVTVDAGTKSFATDASVMPKAKRHPHLEYEFHGDEFGRITAKEGAKLPRLGDRLEFFAPHCDPTVNLYDRIHAVRGDLIEAVWEIKARKEDRRQLS